MVVDAVRGKVVDVRSRCYHNDSTLDFVLLHVDERWFSATALIQYLDDGALAEVLLIVRRFHPAFMFKKVGFMVSINPS